LLGIGVSSMWEIEPYLQKDEIVEYSGKPSWVGYWLIFLLAVIFVVTVFLSIIGILIILFIVLQRESTRYVITNQRVAVRAGIIARNFRALSYLHVTSVTVTQGIIGRIFNFGDIYIKTAGSALRWDIKYFAVQDPVSVKKLIENHVA
jgi:uncharacterized membrane protein YdbT with pleckstrin-like domain